MWHLLRTPRWAAFTALVVLVIVAFGLLSRWQWARAEEHRQERVALQAQSQAAPVELSTRPDQWTPVTATGTYQASLQVVVRKRPLDAQNGFWVLAPLQTTQGMVWINRGWIAATGDALATPSVPAPPTGSVTVIGFARPFEGPADATGLPAGQIPDVDPSVLPAAATAFDGYLQLRESDPAQQGVTTLPLPEIDEGRNISYAVQWLLFAIVAIAGWFYFLRREAREQAQREAVSLPT